MDRRAKVELFEPGAQEAGTARSQSWEQWWISSTGSWRRIEMRRGSSGTRRIGSGGGFVRRNRNRMWRRRRCGAMYRGGKKSWL